jgi:hypothetical protein
MPKKALLKNKTYDNFFSWQGGTEHGCAWVRVSEFDRQHPDWPALRADYPRVYSIIAEFWGLENHPVNLSPEQRRHQERDLIDWKRIYPHPDSIRAYNLAVAIGYGPNFSGRFFYVPFLFAAILGRQIGITPRMCGVSLGDTIARMLRILPHPDQSRDSQRVRETGVILGDLQSPKAQAEWLEVALTVSREWLDAQVAWPL